MNHYYVHWEDETMGRFRSDPVYAPTCPESVSVTAQAYANVLRHPVYIREEYGGHNVEVGPIEGATGGGG